MAEKEVIYKTSGVNYEDDRFKQVEAEKQQQIEKTESMYNGMIGQSDSYYQQQIDASKDWANKQQELQNQQTDLAIEQINQQKDQANKDYTKEQKGAYADFQKQTNAYGANAEQMAASGLSNSGYSETSRVSMYNTYQNRYAMAKDSYNRAILNYDNGIKEARLSNSAKLAEIAYQSLQTQLQLSLEGFQYKNQLLLQQAEAINKVNDTYYNRYQNVLQQINQENALAEQIRQYNEKMAFEREQAKQAQSNWEKEYALTKKSYSSSGSSSKTKTTKQAQLTQDDPEPVKLGTGDTTRATPGISTQVSNALKTFINGAPQKAKMYTSAAEAKKAKGISVLRTTESLLKSGVLSTKVINGKTYYF
jgi:hypothetical protein